MYIRYVHMLSVYIFTATNWSINRYCSQKWWALSSVRFRRYSMSDNNQRWTRKLEIVFTKTKKIQLIVFFLSFRWADFIEKIFIDLQLFGQLRRFQLFRQRIREWLCRICRMINSFSKFSIRKISAHASGFSVQICNGASVNIQKCNWNVICYLASPICWVNDSCNHFQPPIKILFFFFFFYSVHWRYGRLLSRMQSSKFHRTNLLLHMAFSQSSI